MCTLVLAHRVFPRSSLVVAANRDELLARPARGPRVEQGPLRVLAPKDEAAGGTWLGLNERGLFVGITNRAGVAVDQTRASRGLLVARALQHVDAADLHRALSEVQAADFNAFHLLYADNARAFVTWSDGARLTQVSLEPGVYVVTERSLGADDRGRTEDLTRRFEPLRDAPEPDFEALKGLLSFHGPEHEPLAGSCVHADALGYGTRSSFLYANGEHRRAFWCEGHPCRNPFVEITPMLEELGALAGRADNLSKS